MNRVEAFGLTCLGLSLVSFVISCIEYGVVREVLLPTVITTAIVGTVFLPVIWWLTGYLLDEEVN